MNILEIIRSVPTLWAEASRPYRWQFDAPGGHERIVASIASEGRAMADDDSPLARVPGSGDRDTRVVPIHSGYTSISFKRGTASPSLTTIGDGPVWIALTDGKPDLPTLEIRWSSLGLNRTSFDVYSPGLRRGRRGILTAGLSIPFGVLYIVIQLTARGEDPFGILFAVVVAIGFLVINVSFLRSIRRSRIQLAEVVRRRTGATVSQ